MRLLLILIFVQLFLKPAAAQSGKTYRVNSIHQDSTELISSIYRYPQFQKGGVLFTNRPLASAWLNYNYLSGQILFITPKGDTLELANPETLQFVFINIDTFHYVDKGYVEILTHNPTINLSKKQMIEYNGTEKKGAYGTYSSTTAASSINTYSGETLNQKIAIDENTLYATSTQFYLSDKLYKFFPANKKNFYKLFFRQEKMLTAYLKNNTVHFNKENDLRKLIAFLQSN